METITGLEYLTDFWRDMYLTDYIREGGSKIKFVTGRPGSGKTALLASIGQIARQESYCVVSFSARDVQMNDLKEIYFEAFRQCKLETHLAGCANKIIERMGFHPADIPEGHTFLDYLAQLGENDALTKREIRMQLKQMFLENPRLDNNFALACSILTGGILGHPQLEAQNREILLQWLSGDKTVKLSMLRAIGLSPTRITKYNARNMLRSLTEVIHMGGSSGLLLLVDDLEVMVVPSLSEKVSYTRAKREDTYESIRQLIDEIDSMRYFMCVFSFNRALIDDERNGLKSYQALWMRIQNEVSGSRFNRFSDIVDMDRMTLQFYTPELIVQLSAQLLAEKRGNLNPIELTQAQQLLAQTKAGAFGLRYWIERMTLGGEKSE